MALVVPSIEQKEFFLRQGSPNRSRIANLRSSSRVSNTLGVPRALSGRRGPSVRPAGLTQDPDGIGIIGTGAPGKEVFDP